MITITTYTQNGKADHAVLNEIKTFLHQHLEQYGDSIPDIGKAMDYAMGVDGKPGGHIIEARDEKNELLGATVINTTGMSGYIPENILVYIATHSKARGLGIGKQLMQKAIEETTGDMALHCDADNPARHLYEKLGFQNKYLEMRLKK